MDNDNKYNGWKNYETWCVNLWLDNDQGSQEYWREKAEEEIESAKDHPASGFSITESAALSLATHLKEEMEERQESLNICNGMFSDLLNASISEVDFYEIAEAMIEEEIGEKI